MYESFYGLTRKPFALVPDPAFLYLGERHKTALCLLEYAAAESAAFVVLSGEIGTGKTTLVQRFLAQHGRAARVGLIVHTHSADSDVIRLVASAFGLDATGERESVHARFRQFVDGLVRSGQRAVLVVDEAQNLTAEALEELRLLSNLNPPGRRLVLQIVLSGQPQLRALLKRPELCQLVQRISVDYHLSALGLGDTIAYVRHRLRVAGGDPSLFDDLACATVHAHAGGVPRLVNMLCDFSLVYAYAEGRAQIDFDVVQEVAEARRQGGLSGLVEADAKLDRAQVRVRALEALASLRRPQENRTPVSAAGGQ
jgi:type II secretory pathway predicted ATPase ExeA